MPDNTISTRIRAARQSTGKKGYQFAEDVGLRPEQLSRYENGVTPQVDALARIAVAAGVTVDWLLTGRGEGPTGNAPEAA